MEHDMTFLKKTKKTFNIPLECKDKLKIIFI